jgi:hypothetical protein
MPPLQKEPAIVGDDLPDLREFVVAKSAHVRQRDGLEPELGVPTCVSDMDVWRLSPLHAEEEKPVAANSQNRWHWMSLPYHLHWCNPRSQGENSLPLGR